MQGKKVSKPIVRISVISIALAMIVNLVTIAVVTGFQQEVRQKVSGFGSHIFIMMAGENSVYESAPIRRDQDFVGTVQQIPGVQSVSPVGYKPVLFQSDKTETTYQRKDGTDTTEYHYQVHGAVIKGVDHSYDGRFFKQHLIEGEMPKFGKDSVSNQIVISKRLANNLQFKLGDEVGAFFVKKNPIKRNYRIAGIYETGLEEFDKQIVLGDLALVQELNDWGIKAEIELLDTTVNGQLVIQGNVSGGNQHYRYDWGNGFTSYSGRLFCPTRDTQIRLVATDYWSDLQAPLEESSLPDTAYLRVSIMGDGRPNCAFALDEWDELPRQFHDEQGYAFTVSDGSRSVLFESTPGKGSAANYVGGFELMVSDWEELDDIRNKIQYLLGNGLTPYGEMLKTTSVKDSQPDIFVWLSFLDINVAIILTLMLLIGIINMGSALLVLILIRSNFIGLMKSMGATNWSIRKIFLVQSAFLIGRGMIFGNVIGLAICLLQKYTGLISLNPEVYYLAEVPISLNVLHWVLLNVGTLIVCISALILPSAIVSRIDPVKAIKFN